MSQGGMDATAEEAVGVTKSISPASSKSESSKRLMVWLVEEFGSGSSSGGNDGLHCVAMVAESALIKWFQ